MNYVLLMFIGGITGLILSGPAGALFGLVAGFAVSSWEELNKGVEPFEDDCSPNTYSSLKTESCDDDHVAVDTGITNLTTCNDDSYLNSHHINPATGLPMIDTGVGGFDIAGNPYGIDWSSDDMHVDQMSGSEDMFSSSDPFS